MISVICGFVGSTLTRALIERGGGHEIFGFDNFIRPGSETNRADLKKLGVKLFHGDLRVASEDAFFAAHFIRVGLSSCDVGTSYILPRIVGPTVAAELMLTGRRFSAGEANRIGMLNRVVAREGLLDAAADLAAAIAANSEYGVYMTKLGLWANLDAPSLRHAIQLENRTQVLGTFTGNMTEAREAFIEKRAPVWNPM